MMPEAFDPYYKWLGIHPKDQPPHHYRLLGIELFEQDPDVIDAAANRVMSYLKALAAGDEGAYSQKLLNEISRARLCLLNPEKKAAYDAQLREKLKAQGMLDDEPPAPPAGVPPTKTSRPAPPPAEPPGPLPPPPGPTSPPSPGPAFPTVGPPSTRLPDDVVPIVIETHEEPTEHSADPCPETEKQTGRDKLSHRRLGLLASLSTLAVVGFVVALVFYGGGEPSQTTDDMPSPRRKIAAEPPVLVLDIPPHEARALTAFLLDDVPQELPPKTRYVLSAGRHRIVLRRHGYQEIVDTFVLVDGQTRRYRPPRWRRKPGAPGADAPGGDRSVFR